MNSLYTILIKVLVLQSVISENVREYGNNTVNEYSVANKASKVLSRRKRFVIFPDGSSVQLVFQNQHYGQFGLSSIFRFGHTMALAWPLPTDPKYISMIKGNEGVLRRSDVKTTINYFDADGAIIAKVPYKRRIIVNPAFAKRSVDDNQLLNEEKLNRKEMHKKHMNMDLFKTEDMDKEAIEFHRSNLLDIYKRLETWITALGGDGRQCVLYKLCEAARRRQNQGTFLQEFLEAVFTLPKGAEEHKEYDAAHTPSEDCQARYPGC